MWEGDRVQVQFPGRARLARGNRKRVPKRDITRLTTNTEMGYATQTGREKLSLVDAGLWHPQGKAVMS